MRERLFPRWCTALFALLPMSELLYLPADGQSVYAAALACTVCALVGIGAAKQLGSGMFISAFVGVVTGVGGGVMRDIMSGDIPFVFRKYFYCSASIIGAVVTAALWDTIGAVPAMLLGGAVIVLLRFLAARFRWRLPRAVTDGDIDAGDLTVRRASADGREDGSADDKRG